MSGFELHGEMLCSRGNSCSPQEHGAFRHLSLPTSVACLRRPPADVVDGNVPKLFVHGRLAPLPRRHIQGRLCMLVGYADFYVVAGN